MYRPAALITGSSRGIGLATAIELAKAGFSVALNGPEDNQELRAAVEETASYGGPIAMVVVDVSDLRCMKACLISVNLQLDIYQRLSTTPECRR